MVEDFFEEAKQCIDTYLKSVRTFDFELMRSVAHQDGRIYIGNESTSKNLHVHWADDKRRFTPERIAELQKKMVVKLLSFQVEGTIAFAKIQMGGWIDYHNLVKTPEGWKLVDKVSHRIE